MLSCIGDMHINALDRHIKDAYKQVLSTFEKVATNEMSKGTSAIVQLGDVFHNAFPDEHYIRAFIQSVYRINKVPVYIIMGNHDFADVKNHALRTVAWLFKIGFLKGKVFTKPEILKIDGDKYLFSPHPYVVDKPDKDVRLCFGHFGFEGARGDNGYVIKSGNAPSGRWVLGDYHTAQRGKSYAYPGSLTQIQFHENPDKFIIRIDEDVKTVKINPDIKLGRTTVNSIEELDALDAKTYWSINVASKVKLPADWAAKYPHVVKHHADKDSSKRQRVLMKQVASENPLEGFGNYLQEQGLSRKEVKRTLQLIGVDENV